MMTLMLVVALAWAIAVIALALAIRFAPVIEPPASRQSIQAILGRTLATQTIRYVVTAPDGTQTTEEAVITLN